MAVLRIRYIGIFLILAIGLSFLLPSLVMSVNEKQTVTEINWESLIPEDWNPSLQIGGISSNQIDQLMRTDPEKAQEMLDEIEQISAVAPVVPELDGKLVKIPGYVVPLEFDSTSVSEFLLVPYVGACIHVPPPPANQVVYSQSDEKVDIEGLFAPVWVTGTLRTQSFSSELAEAGYSLKVRQVEPYVW